MSGGWVVFGLEAVLLFGAAVVAGGINAIAGGGGLLVFPALLLSGISPISANATSAAGIWVGMLVNNIAYRSELRPVAKWLGPVTVATLAGGALGAWLLLNFSDEGFAFIVPYLVALGTLLFAIAPKLARWTQQSSLSDEGLPAFNQSTLLFFQGVISIYGGFFGGGAGILMLTLLSLTNPGRLQMLQAVKVWLALCINAAALSYFVFADIIDWPYAGLVAVGTSAGGYSSVYLAQKVSAVWLRHFVIATGTVLSIYFFTITYE
ncbi:MAG: sulfite exporter TauE/SafE family protein [Cyanobacteria bacterium J06598_1]